MKINEEVNFASYIQSNYLTSKNLKNADNGEEIVESDSLEFVQPLFSLKNPNLCEATDSNNVLSDYPSYNSLYENELHNYEKMKINGEIYTVKRGTANPKEIKTVKCEKCETKYSIFDYLKCPVCENDKIDIKDDEYDENEELLISQEKDPKILNDNKNEIISNYMSKCSKNDTNDYYYKIPNKLSNSSSWQCEMCSYMNKSLSLSCEMCNEPRRFKSMNNFIRSLKEGSLIDCKDRRGIWYPAKVVKKSRSELIVHFRGWKEIFDEILYLNNPIDQNRISDYESNKNSYGLHLYTIQYFSDEKIRDEINKLCNLENPDLKSIYIKNKSVFYRGLNGLSYEYKIISYDDNTQTLCLNTNDGVLYDVPINMVTLDRPKNRYLQYSESAEEEEESSFKIPLDNIRNVINSESNIDIATNRFITDFSRNTIYKNDDGKGNDFFFNNINK